jgi:hypothetical protein
MSKAVIFSCSLKQPNYSSTKAWSVLLAKRLALKGIESQIINLRDYDYESSTDKDELHEQLKYVYDASLIIFASPTNIYNPTFSCTNLVDRFVHAHKKSKKNQIDIFKNKYWEYCQFQSLDYVSDSNGGVARQGYFGADHCEWINHHGYMLKTLPFINHLGLTNTHVDTYAAPAGFDGPNYDDMEDHKEAVQVCDDIVETWYLHRKKQKGFDTKDATPTCSLERFLEFFESDDSRAFGRGTTIADENINEQSVKTSIAHVHKTMSNVCQKSVVFISMKERCTRLGLLDLAEMYYIEQFTINRSRRSLRRKLLRRRSLRKRVGVTEYPREHSGNYRPNGY